MRIKLDENLPVEIETALSAQGLDCDTVEDEGLVGAEDPDVWKACLSEARLLVTQDLDFSDLRRFLPGTHPGIVLVRLSQPSRRRLIDSVAAFFASGEDVGRCFVVLSDHKVRIHRPPAN